MRRGITAAIAGSALALSAPAFGQETPPTPHHEPTPGDMGTARNALKEGLALRDKGDLPGALARLQTAFDLVPTPITGFELAKTHMLLGHVLSAHEAFMKVVRMPLSLEESSRSQTAREESTKIAKDLEPRIPSLHVKLTLPAGASAVVKIDDEEITKPGADMTRTVDPGPHDVSAKAGDGPEQTIHVEVAESETKDVALSPQWIAPKPVAVTGPGGQVIYVRTTNPLTFVGFGFAAAGLVVVGIGTVVLLNARSDIQNMCGQQYCPPRSTIAGQPKNTLVDQAYDRVYTRYQAAGIAIFAGALTTVIFGAVGTIGALRPIKEKVTARLQIHPMFAPTNTGVYGTF